MLVTKLWPKRMANKCDYIVALRLDNVGNVEEIKNFLNITDVKSEREFFQGEYQNKYTFKYSGKDYIARSVDSILLYSDGDIEICDDKYVQEHYIPHVNNTEQHIVKSLRIATLWSYPYDIALVAIPVATFGAYDITFRLSLYAPSNGEGYIDVPVELYFTDAEEQAMLTILLDVDNSSAKCSIEPKEVEQLTRHVKNILPDKIKTIEQFLAMKNSINNKTYTIQGF